MAEGIFRDKVIKAGLSDKIHIDSAGTSTWHIGEPPDKRAQAMTEFYNIDISKQKARQIKKADFEEFDFILPMDNSNLQKLKSLAEIDTHPKIQLLLKYAEMKNITEVPDPYYGGNEGFQNVYNLINSACDRLLSHIKECQG